MPFWPSFEPWAKLTPRACKYQERANPFRSGALPSGAWNNAGLRSTAFASSKSPPATKTDEWREKERLTVSPTLAQLTPSPKALSDSGASS